MTEKTQAADLSGDGFEIWSLVAQAKLPEELVSRGSC